MLKSLYIKNIALITEVKIEFEKGLNVLSGETGAGKSIIIDSLAFVLGERADKSLIKSGENDAFVEAVFLCDDEKTQKAFADYSEGDELCVISRKMSVQGKNEIRINGRLSSLAALKEITSELVDIFSQNQQTFLLKPENHIEILDGFRQNKELFEKISQSREQLDEINGKLKTFGGDKSERERLIDILSYQIKEISDAELKENEDEMLLAQKQKFQNAEKINYALQNVLNLLYDGQTPSLSQISSAQSFMAQIGKLDEGYQSLADRLESAKYEIQDIAQTAESMMAETSFDSFALDEIESRLDKIKALKRKYGGSIAAVLEFLADSQNKLENIINADAEIEKLNAKREKVLDEMYRAAKSLSEFRKESAKEFEKQIMVELADLGIKNAVFEVNFQPFPERYKFNGCDKNGADIVEFYFSANKGEPKKPLAKIISGGEMSRFMLALKNVTAKIEKIPTMVFDEIDTGISGKIAEVVGQKLCAVSKDYQILVITHLPQIACFSDEHFLIQKSVVGEKTITDVRLLDEEGKINEVARLLGGDIGSYGILHAKDMLFWANEVKSKN